MGIKEIVSWAISVATFPGVIFDVFVRAKMCAASGVKVNKKCYFQLGYPAGYVKHGRTQGFRSSFLVSIMPFILSTAGAAAFVLPVVLTTQYLPGSGYVGLGPLDYLLQWLGMSLAFHAIPRSGSEINYLGWFHSAALTVRILYSLGVRAVLLVLLQP